MAPISTATFAVGLGNLRGRLDPAYVGAQMIGRQLLSRSSYPIVELGSIIDLAQYGISEKASSTPAGVPILRMGNLRDEGLDTKDLKYVELASDQLNRYKLRSGDILVNRTNSKELVGKCAVFDLPGDWVFASYLIRLQVDKTLANPRYVSRFLMSTVGRHQIDRISRQAIGMANINLSEIRGFLLPLPPLAVQDHLAEEVDGAWSSRMEEIARARKLEEELGVDAACSLGLPPDPPPPPPTFSVTLHALRGRRIDVAANRPGPPLAKTSQYELTVLEKIASIDSERLRSSLTGEVPYVGLPECSRTGIESISFRSLDSLGSASLAKAGDILIARIEPSVYNRKFVFIDSLPAGVERVATSGEFYVVRPKLEVVDAAYLYAIFFTNYLYAQIVGKTTGSSGRRRIPRDLFDQLQIPLPPIAVQRDIGRHFMTGRNEIKALRQSAEERWLHVRAHFDQTISGKD